MKDRYVFDSSIWIEMERGNHSILQFAEPILRKNQVCLVDVIAVEVLRGTRSRRDFQKLKAAFADFVQLTTRWEAVAELAFKMARSGFQPPLIDLYIAQAVMENRKILVTQDKHFKQMASRIPLKIEFLAPRSGS